MSNVSKQEDERSPSWRRLKLSGRTQSKSCGVTKQQHVPCASSRLEMVAIPDNEKRRSVTQAGSGANREEVHLF